MIGAVLGGTVAALSLAAGAFWYGTTVGADGQIAKQKKTEDLVTSVAQAAQSAAAAEIAKIKPRNVTVRQELEREITKSIEYRDCKHTDDGLRVLNEAITGGKVLPPSGGQLPGTHPDDRSQLRGDDEKVGRSFWPILGVPGGGIKLR